MSIPNKQVDIDALAKTFRSNFMAVKEHCEALVSDSTVGRIVFAKERITAAKNYFDTLPASITLGQIGVALDSRYGYGSWDGYSAAFLSLNQIKIPALLAAISNNEEAIFTAFTFDLMGKINQSGELSVLARTALLVLVNDVLSEYD